VFLTIGILFHGHLLVLMNIGMFAPIMLLTYMVFLSGPELASILRARPALARLGVPGIPADVRAGRGPIPTEDPRLPHLHRDAARLPVGRCSAAWLLATGAIVLAAQGLPGARPASSSACWRCVVGRSSPGAATAGARSPPAATLPAGSTVGLRALGAVPGRRLVVYHITAVAVWCMPDKQCLQDVPRRRAGAVPPVADAHPHGAGLGDVRPEPPAPQRVPEGAGDRRAGEAHDMRTDMYAPGRKPVPWILNDRIFKMNRRMSGGEAGKGDWYQKWYGRYHCREWALQHGGVAPRRSSSTR
jgi:hypothetical protein